MAGSIGKSAARTGTSLNLPGADREFAAMDAVAKKLDKLSKLMMTTLLQLAARQKDLCMDCAQHFAQLGSSIHASFIGDSAGDASSSSASSTDEYKSLSESLLARMREVQEKQEPSQTEVFRSYEEKVAQHSKLLELITRTLEEMAKTNCTHCQGAKDQAKPGDPRHLMYT